MLTALRRKIRLGMQRTVLIAVLLAVGVFSYAFLNLSFCFKLMSHRSLTHMVSKKITCYLYIEHRLYVHTYII